MVISPDDDNITISHGETTIPQKKEILLQARNGLVQDDDNCSKCSSRIMTQAPKRNEDDMTSFGQQLTNPAGSDVLFRYPYYESTRMPYA